jgi:hypothetical protein
MEEAKVYYHCSPKQLDPGTIITPGNYGRILLQTGVVHPHWRRESVLEQVRIELFPLKPSRLNSCFLLTSLEAAKFYQSKNTKGDFLYTCEIVEPHLPQHFGDFNAVEPLPRLNYTMEEIAVRYWSYSLKTRVESYPNLFCEELLTSSSIRIRSKLVE